jgi:uncharacterized protein
MDIKELEKLIENDNLSEIIALLGQEPQLATATTSYQTTPVLLACYYKKEAIANSIANFIPQLDIYDACALGKLEGVGSILAQNPSIIDENCDSGFTPLGLACYFAHENIVKFLVEKGADVNIQSKNGYNIFPIHSAALANNLNIVQILLSAGAYPNVCQKTGLTALHTAAQLGNIELIISLLEQGADITLKTDEGKIPADLAAEKGFHEIADILKLDD